MTELKKQLENTLKRLSEARENLEPLFASLKERGAEFSSLKLSLRDAERAKRQELNAMSNEVLKERHLTNEIARKDWITQSLYDEVLYHDRVKQELDSIRLSVEEIETLASIDKKLVDGYCALAQIGGESC